MCLSQELAITAKKTGVLHGEFKGSDLSMTEPTAALSPLYHLYLHPTNGNCHCAPDQSATGGKPFATLTQSHTTRTCPCIQKTVRYPTSKRVLVAAVVESSSSCCCCSSILIYTQVFSNHTGFFPDSHQLIS